MPCSAMILLWILPFETRAIFIVPITITSPLQLFTKTRRLVPWIIPPSPKDLIMKLIWHRRSKGNTPWISGQATIFPSQKTPELIITTLLSSSILKTSRWRKSYSVIGNFRRSWSIHASWRFLWSVMDNPREGMDSTPPAAPPAMKHAWVRSSS